MSNPSLYTWKNQTTTELTGGDSMTTDLNYYFQAGDMAWIMTSTALVFIMIPGVGFFYSGLARRKSALSLIYLSMMSIAIVSVQWFIWGYSLTFSHTGSVFLGDFHNVFLKETLALASVGSPYIPDILFCVFQLMFAAITPALAIGGAAERGRMIPLFVFMFVWTTIVYDPIAYWTWNGNGWLYNLPAYDFAGGSPVHISSGTAALAYAMMLGKRHGHGTRTLNYRPHNVTHVILGTVFLWFGWFGFNGGSALGANIRAVMACVVTNLAAAVGGLTWCLLDYRLERKWSAVGFCSGAVAGLVAITPASGFVTPWAAVIFGVVGGACCNFATKLKYYIGVDDALDVFAEHGIGGIVGNLLTGIFAADYIAALDGINTSVDGGWINGVWVQLARQLADSAAAFGWSFVVTSIILFVMNLIPGLSLRVPLESEIMGIDEAELGEFAYDYVERERDYVERSNEIDVKLESAESMEKS